MQPDNNVQNEATTPVMAKPMEAPETAPEMPNMMQGSDKKQTNKGMILGMILLAILAIGGIGFGVWAMMDGNQQKANYDKQITDLKEQNSELLSKLSDANDDGDVIIDVDTDTSGVDTADYIYVGEWGLKIKIPNNLSSVSYDYIRNSNGPAVVVVGANYDGGSVPEGLFEYMGITGLGSIQRYTKGAEIAPTSPPSLVFSDDNYDYYYHSPQAVYQLSSEEGKERQNKIIELVKEMFTNLDNYSKI